MGGTELGRVLSTLTSIQTLNVRYPYPPKIVGDRGMGGGLVQYVIETASIFSCHKKTRLGDSGFSVSIFLFARLTLEDPQWKRPWDTRMEGG
jgi:hypothetical protein